MNALIPAMLFAMGLFTSGENPRPGYQWRLAAPAGSGCLQPNCEPGKFPMAVVPIEPTSPFQRQNRPGRYAAGRDMGDGQGGR
jgi:hypothetical protein